MENSRAKFRHDEMNLEFQVLRCMSKKICASPLLAGENAVGQMKFKDTRMQLVN